LAENARHVRWSGVEFVRADWQTLVIVEGEWRRASEAVGRTVSAGIAGRFTMLASVGVGVAIERDGTLTGTYVLNTVPETL
jgi:hypothetical protein